MSLWVSELYRYPVKSCRGEPLREAPLDARGIAGDRLFMIVDPAGVFLTQRELPALCRIVPLVGEGALTLRAPSAEDLVISIRRGPGDCEVTVWNDRCAAVDQGDEAAAWLERVLGCPARLVRMAEEFIRPVDPHYAVRPTDHLHFGDGFPSSCSISHRWTTSIAVWGRPYLSTAFGRTSSLLARRRTPKMDGAGCGSARCSSTW